MSTIEEAELPEEKVSPFRTAVEAFIAAARVPKGRFYATPLARVIAALVEANAELWPGDFHWIRHQGALATGGHNLITPNGGEGFYGHAAQWNPSACKAFEVDTGRKPWWHIDHETGRKVRAVVHEPGRGFKGGLVLLPDPDGVWRLYRVNSFRNHRPATEHQPEEHARINMTPDDLAPIRLRGTRARVGMGQAEFAALLKAPPGTLEIARSPSSSAGTERT